MYNSSFRDGNPCCKGLYNGWAKKNRTQKNLYKIAKNNSILLKFGELIGKGCTICSYEFHVKIPTLTVKKNEFPLQTVF